MGKGTFIALVALLIAVAGAIVAFAAYFKHRSCTICDDFEDDFMDEDLDDLDYYATQVEEDEDEQDMSTLSSDDEAEEDGLSKDLSNEE